jgi:hypothetical protein
MTIKITEEMVEAAVHAFLVADTDDQDCAPAMRLALEASHLAAGEAREVAWAPTREAIAAAIANARGMRRGVPTIKNILDILPAKLRDEVLDDADNILSTCASPTPAATVPPAGAMDAGTAPQDRLPRDRDIILEALNEYDGWLKDDDYDSKACLARIMGRMRDRALGMGG